MGLARRIGYVDGDRLAFHVSNSVASVRFSGSG
jgi:hypothetical protein